MSARHEAAALEAGRKENRRIAAERRRERERLRDEFAMAALPALIARHRADVAWSEIAPLAYEIADAMMEDRGK